MTERTWISAGPLTDLEETGQKIVRHNGKQILLLSRGDKLYACNNRCPHQGYPLAEGTTLEPEPGKCLLTCNWHNWQFDLDSGEALVGGDAVRLYPLEVRGGDIFLDITDPPKGGLLPKILKNLDEAYDDYDYDRIARELARYRKDGGDLTDVMRHAVLRAHTRFEYGMSHAFAAAADWMTLSDQVADDETRSLITYLEPTAHMAWDTLRRPLYPYTEDEAPWDPAAFLDSIEAIRENQAVALLRGALSAGLVWSDLEPTFAEAALAHYQDFGHAAIYVQKSGELIEKLGPKTTLPVALALTRELIYASREDLIPEFRTYKTYLESWTGDGKAPVAWQDFQGLSVKEAMARTVASSAQPASLHTALLGANAWNFLHFNTDVEAATDNPIARNVGWLDFTHGITFAHAVRTLCTRYPHLWPQGLLQMACFAGRNAPFTDRGLETASFNVPDFEHFFEATMEGLFDHAQFEHIVSCHYVKLTFASREEVGAVDNPEVAGLVAAALNRLLHHKIKRRHVLRSANQALKFVALEA